MVRVRTETYRLWKIRVSVSGFRVGEEIDLKWCWLVIGSAMNIGRGAAVVGEG